MKPGDYLVTVNLNLYDSPACKDLATQAQQGRRIQVQPLAPDPDYPPTAYPVLLQEDDYPAWIAATDLTVLTPTSGPYYPPQPSIETIAQGRQQAIAFTQQAMTQPNCYLWGGTVGPNYDCSGLVQHAFSAQGIWLPRDAYQQEAFVQPLPNPGTTPADLVDVLQPGDLLFFGTPIKATHVALYLGEGRYIHSSGKDQGRDGIGIDTLAATDHPVSRTYYEQVRSAGRVIRSYQPDEKPWLAEQS